MAELGRLQNTVGLVVELGRMASAPPAAFGRLESALRLENSMDRVSLDRTMVERREEAAVDREAAVDSLSGDSPNN